MLQNEEYGSKVNLEINAMLISRLAVETHEKKQISKKKTYRKNTKKCNCYMTVKSIIVKEIKMYSKNKHCIVYH